MAFNFKRPKFTSSGAPIQARDVKRASASLNFPSVAAAASSTLTITVPGVVVGDDAFVALDAPVAGLVYVAWVSATDTVTVRVTNVTAAAIDAPATTHRVIVFKAY